MFLFFYFKNKFWLDFVKFNAKSNRITEKRGSYIVVFSMKPGLLIENVFFIQNEFFDGTV